MKTKYFNSDCSGKVAVITGGSGILCGEMARELASMGASVAVLGRTKSKKQNTNPTDSRFLVEQCLATR